MIVLVALLWLMSSILLFTNPKDDKTRWGSYIGYFGGLGGFGVLLGKGIERPEWIIWLDAISTSVGHYFTPYAILIFGLLYSEVIKTKGQQLFWKLLLFIPVILMYTPLFPFTIMYPDFDADYLSISIWIAPYIVISCLLLSYSAWKETRPSIKNQKIITCIIVIPMFLFALTTNILIEAFLGITQTWMYNPIIIAIQFLLFLYLGTKYGFLGVQIKFEKQRIHSSMQAASSGTALLNHTIKNEVGKIDLLTTQLREVVSEEKHEKVDLILKSTEHVLELSSRIQSKLDIMELKETNFRIIDILRSAVGLMQPHLSKVKIIEKFEEDVSVYGDYIHIQEVFLNILKNALEAMNYSGTITIRVYRNRKLYIDFSDTGKGIEKEHLSKIIEPFYSTKKKVGNFGLGLTYCYNVLSKHGGNIEISSKFGQGSTISLSLPKKRIIKQNIKQVSKKNYIEDITHG